MRTGRLADPFVNPHVDGVAGLLADHLAQRGPHREPVRAVALGHQRAGERLTVNLPTDLDQAPGAEQFGDVIHPHAGPRAPVIALVELSIELSDHRPETLSRGRARRRGGGATGQPCPPLTIESVDQTHPKLSLFERKSALT